MLTLCQFEVIRAIMVTGAVGGAARLLNVSSPGINRVVKHAGTASILADPRIAQLFLGGGLMPTAGAS